MEKIDNYIGGQIVPPGSGGYFETFNPALGQPYAQVADSDEQDIERAVTAAAQAFPTWSVKPAEERSAVLLRIADLIQSRAEELALAESIDTGKPLSLARSVDIPRAEANFRFFATAILHEFSESHAMEERGINYTLRKSIGVVGCLSPWNLPLYLFTWKIAPALATGNCVVGKPSEIAPVTALLLAKICMEAGLPPGVLNIVQGYGHKVGAAISSHPQVPAMSFTGGTETGKRIAAAAAPFFKKLALEMGGKNPNIVFADCQYEDMLETTLRSSFSNQGQICTCGSRILVERPLYERFRADFVARTRALSVGDPLEKETDQGALVSSQQLEKVQRYISLAQQEGGSLLCGGEQIAVPGRCSQGWFFAPTVIDGLPLQARTNQDEIFGPLVTLMPFESEEEALALANGTQYGLSASLWTGDLTRAHRMANQVRAGIVWVNCWMLRDLRTPFGGMKNSGLGREGGMEALRFFTEPKNVCIKL